MTPSARYFSYAHEDLAAARFEKRMGLPDSKCWIQRLVRDAREWNRIALRERAIEADHRAEMEWRGYSS